MNIGITSPDILLSYGSVQSHMTNVINILNNYYNIVYFPDPRLYKEFKKHKSDVIEKSNELEKSGIKITKHFYKILNNNYNYNEILGIYARENIDFIFAFEVIENMLFKENFTLKLSKQMNLKFGASLHGIADYNLHMLNYIYSTVKLSKNFHIFLYRLFHYINHHVIIYRLKKCKNLEFLCIINRYYYENININLKNVNVLNISNGINNSKINIFNYKKQEKENKIIFFSRLIYNKGIFEIPKILKIIIQNYNTKLILVGNFVHENEKVKFFKMVNKLKLNDYIIYKVFLSDDELYNEISTSQLMIYPSHSDSFSIAVVQALALCTPVIAYSIAGLKIYKNFKSVTLVKEFDYQSLADEALKILRVTNSYDLFNDKINEFIKEHTWYNVAMEYKNIIDKYINNQTKKKIIQQI